MTIGTTELNPGVGGDKMLNDSLATVNGVAAPTDAKAQLVKVTFGDEGDAKMVSATQPLPTFDDANNGLLRRILLMLMAPLGYDKSSQRQRVTANIENLPTLAAVTTVTTVTTVGAVTNLNGINGRNADMDLNANINTAWALTVRARIT